MFLTIIQFMPKTKNANLIFTITLFIVSVIAYILFIRTTQFQEFITWSQANKSLYIFLLLSLKIVSNVYPPLPGGIFTLGSIPVLGWKTAYAVDFAGSFIGSIICYYLARKYGFAVLRKIFDENLIERIKQVKVNKKREIEGLIIWRVLGGGTVIEAIYYGAGLLNINFRNFLVGTTISHLLVGIPSFYLTRELFSSRNIVLNVFLLTIAVFILYKIKGRYFE